MPLPDAKHPIWPILRMAVTFTGVMIMLHFTATHFDAGEVKAAGGASLVVLTFDLIKRAFAQG